MGSDDPAHPSSLGTWEPSSQPCTAAPAVPAWASLPAVPQLLTHPALGRPSRSPIAQGASAPGRAERSERIRPKCRSHAASKPKGAELTEIHHRDVLKWKAADAMVSSGCRGSHAGEAQDRECPVLPVQGGDVQGHKIRSWLSGDGTKPQWRPHGVLVCRP